MIPQPLLNAELLLSMITSRIKRPPWVEEQTGRHCQTFQLLQIKCLPTYNSTDQISGL